MVANIYATKWLRKIILLKGVKCLRQWQYLLEKGSCVKLFWIVNRHRLIVLPLENL